jgi:hypothetical protein
MNSSKSVDKAQMIERSLRCFTCGLLGLLPGIGLPFAAVALNNFLKVKLHMVPVWNPAERYLAIGALCAIAGLGLTVIIVSAIMIEVS